MKKLIVEEYEKNLNFRYYITQITVKNKYDLNLFTGTNVDIMNQE